MESSTVAVVLALTLACTGGMFLLISHQITGRSGMATFALGLALFGLVFAVPPSVDQNASLLLGMAIDTIAVAAVLLLRRGMQRFMQRHELSWRALAALLLAYALLSMAARLAFGDAARALVLDLSLGLLFAWLALTTARDAYRDNPLLRMPLALLAGVLSLLSLLSFGQAIYRADSTPGADADRIYEAVLMLSALLLGPTLLWLHTVQLTRQIGELSTRDALTRLLNENGLDEVLRRHFARRQHEPVSLMHIDVDHFARVNALHGESSGDDVLRMIGLALESGLRADDFVARVGGEEFVVGCVSADVGQAAVLAERLRAAVAAVQTGLSEGGGHLRCTVSIGLSRPFGDIDQWRNAWREAEVSLQAAKDAGCNCVVHPTAA
ncbi:MAG: GGDEF domain-containing protein [Rubrivivax sp.]|jgi:diguanylate cyclase (GGDEF)-like protein|nr:GGDEF domain-containing protein [Rubrivivax sp.]MBK8525949.1 GGDEF domain-containing protein [Rubrivivax sp.]